MKNDSCISNEIKKAYQRISASATAPGIVLVAAVTAADTFAFEEIAYP